MNSTITSNTGLSTVIAKLQQQKDELLSIYHSAINNGEKFQSVKTLYVVLKDIDKRLCDLMRGKIAIAQ